MLKHRAIGPTPAGAFLVVYPIPGCDVPHVVCDCTTAAQAKDETKRLNKIQRKQAKAEQRAQVARERRDQSMPGGTR